jgi:hypothetical protein
MGPVDLVIAALVLGGAGWLLWRTVVRPGGACAGCSQRGACQTPTRDVVRLGGVKGPACPSDAGAPHPSAPPR